MHRVVPGEGGFCSRYDNGGKFTRRRASAREIADKVMHHLVEYLLAVPEEDIALLGIQDIALCDLWYNNRTIADETVEGMDDIPELVKKYLDVAGDRSHETTGRRHQTVLRELIDFLLNNQIEKMERDELDLLYRVHELSVHAKNEKAFERVRGRIAPFLDAINKRRASLDAVPGLPRLTSKLRVVTTDEIRRARPRDIRYVAGVEMPQLGPVLSQRGHLRVLGDVPENATLVVEDGSCVVDGYVMGRVAVTGACEVMENVSGTVVARNGDVRLRNAVDGAFIVSKRGWVHCREARNPKIIFAGERIRVRNDTVQGKYVSKDILIQGTASGGEFHVGSQIVADHFTRAKNGQLNIAFRRRLSCKDYGEEPGRRMAIEVSTALRLREKLTSGNQMTNIALTEAEQLASNTLMYLLVGRDIKKVMDKTLSCERRLNVINRVIMSLRNMYAETVRKIETPADTEIELMPSDANAADELMDQLEDEIDNIGDSGDPDEDITQERSEMDEMRRVLSTDSSDVKILRRTLASVGDKLNNWLKEIETLNEEIERNRGLIRKALEIKNIPIEVDDGGHKLVTLQKFVDRAKKADPESTIAKRLATPFISLMLKSIQNKVNAARRSRERIAHVRDDFDTARDLVWENYQMDISPDDDSLKEMKAVGRYDPGVKIHADAHFLDEDHGNAPAGASIITRGSAKEEVSYVCKSGLISSEADLALEPARV